MSLFDIPNELKELNQWVVWKLEMKMVGNSNKEIKVPYNPKTGYPAKTNKPDSWGSFSRAMTALEDGEYKGLGFVFTANDPFAGIDFDDAIENGELGPDAQKWVNHFDSYTEISQSGTGIHILISSNDKLGSGRNNHGGIEIYDRGRYFAITGDILGGRSEIREASFRKLLQDEFETPVNDTQKNYADLDVMMREGVSQGEINNSLVTAVGAIHNRGGSFMEAVAIAKMIIEASGLDYNAEFTEKEVERLFNDFDSRRVKIDFEEYPWVTTTKKGKLKLNAPVLAKHIYKTYHIVSYRDNYWVFDRGRLTETHRDYVAKLVNECIPGELTSSAVIRDVTYQVKAMASIQKYPEFNMNYNLLHFTNGTLDLNTFELREHRISDAHMFTTGYDYDPAAVCPVWNGCMKEWYPDAEIRRYIQKLRGYQLLGENLLNIISELLSRGGTGKSTEWQAIKGSYGEYMEIATSDTFKALKSDGNNTPTFDLVTFEGKRLIIVSEITNGDYCNIESLKRLTGDLWIKVRAPHEKSRMMKGLLNIEIWVNDHPKTKDLDQAVRRRFRIIDRNCEINAFDNEIAKKLDAEKAGIMNWILEGLRLYQEEGLEIPEVIQKFTTDTLEDNDRVMQFWQECVVEEERSGSKGTKAKCVYEAYKLWCRECSYQSIGRNEFYKKLEDCGKKRNFGAQNIRYYKDTFLTLDTDFEDVIR
jgi:P4 family phage/plasmid primase-like protien